MWHFIAVEDDYESLPSDEANFSDTDSDDEDEGDDDERKPSIEQQSSEHEYKEEKRCSVTGASITIDSVQANKAEKKETKSQSQVITKVNR